jgi:hypothetical protein
MTNPKDGTSNTGLQGKVLSTKPERPFGKPWCGWEDNICHEGGEFLITSKRLSGFSSTVFVMKLISSKTDTFISDFVSISKLLSLTS